MLSWVSVQIYFFVSTFAKNENKNYRLRAVFGHISGHVRAGGRVGAALQKVFRGLCRLKTDGRRTTTRRFRACSQRLANQLFACVWRLVVRFPLPVFCLLEHFSWPFRPVKAVFWPCESSLLAMQKLPFDNVKKQQSEVQRTAI